MKKTFLFFSAAIISFTVIAQPAATKPVSQDIAFADALNKIVADFRNNFINIQGEKLPAEADGAAFKSKVCLPGTTDCKVRRFRSDEDRTASWQALSYTGESYEEAVKNYKKVFGLIKKAKVKGPDATSGNFNGNLEKIEDNLRFTVSSLRLKTNDKVYKDLVAEVELLSNITGWEVHVNIYSKKLIVETEKEDEMQ